MQGIEPLLQQLRIRKVLPEIPQGSVVVDFGCDSEVTLLRQCHDRIAYGIGLDIVAEPRKESKRAILRADLEKTVPIRDSTADVVTMLAVLEHLRHPERAIAEACRILKPGGVFLVTVPAPRIELLLPVLAKLQLVRSEMIEQHEHYFTPQELEQAALTAGFRSATAEYWELGCNVYLQAVK